MQALNMEYKPSAALKSISATVEAQKLWGYLCSPESLIRMETATFLRKPALEPVAPYLREEFGFFRSEVTDKASYDNFKKLAGSMARQVMEAMGYEHERDGVHIRGEVFKTASRYKKPE